jgi:hypothetical protein
MRLGGFRYEIHHIAGEQNVWAGMVSHWARLPATLSARRIRTRAQGQQDRLTLRPLDDEGFVWPTIESIGEAQRKFGGKGELSRLDKGDAGVRCKGQQLWIPAEASNLLRRLYIAAPRATVAGTPCWHTSAASSMSRTSGNVWTGSWQADSCVIM